MSRYIVSVVVLGFSIAVMSCGDDQEEQRKLEWIENEVRLKAERHRKERMDECMAKILQEAEIFVDSLLANNDLFMEIVDETIPDRPEKPEFVPLDSSLLEQHSVKPVMKEW